MSVIISVRLSLLDSVTISPRNRAAEDAHTGHRVMLQALQNQGLLEIAEMNHGLLEASIKALSGYPL